MEVADLFPFFPADPSTESLAFSTVCFSQELGSSSTFRKHELHKQGAFLALRPVTHIFGSHLDFVSLSLCQAPLPLSEPSPTSLFRNRPELASFP